MIVICSFARTPIAKFGGALSSMKGSELGSVAIRGALSRLSNPVHEFVSYEAIFGNVVSAGMGQAPARQAAIGAGLPVRTVCTTINKVCASGMKSVMLAAQTLQCSPSPDRAIICGGFESMSRVPHYLVGSRTGTPLGHTQLLDGVIHDGLWDVYNNQHMGMCAEKCAQDFAISREEQDAYAIESYRRAQNALTSGYFEEIVPVIVPQKRGDSIVLDKDDEPFNVNIEKIPALRPAFMPDGGTVTAANASSLNDGAAALVVMTEEDAITFGMTPLARILGFADAEQNPVNFTTSPSLAVQLALENTKLVASDLEYHEINEAFSVVAIANMKLMNLDHNRVNVLGGAVALGHPIGMSGARIIGTLYDVLKVRDATLGCASICNGGGGASAIIIERLV